MGFTHKHALPGAVLGFLILIVMGCWLRVFTHLATLQAPPSAAPSQTQGVEPKSSQAGLALRFEPNLGQTAPTYDFLCRTPGANLFTGSTQAVLVLRAAPRGEHLP
jgi:hypothetical protein